MSEIKTKNWPDRFSLWARLILGVCSLLLWSNQAAATELMLPQTYQTGTEVSGWLMSEKLDGVRGSWDGRQLWSKQGKLFHPPPAFIEGFPPFPLEGEIWGGRGSFEQTVGIVQREQPDKGWLQLKFAIFDVPQAAGGFTNRLSTAKDWFAAHPSPHAFLIKQTPISDAEHLGQELARIERLGGEGLIIRRPDGLYRVGRNPEILKLKSYQDAEAQVIDWLPGRGRNLGRMGALLVAEEGGRQFKIGSGFSDAERDSPPPVGAVITFKYYGRFQSGMPKFPVFLRVRSDLDL